jgi:predicted CopG family antitoxin
MKPNGKLTTIAVSAKNYLALKRLGNAGDSFNDVVTEVLRKIKEPSQTDTRVGASVNQSTSDSMKTISEGDSIHG